METVFAKKAFLNDGWADNVRIAAADGRIVELSARSQSQASDTLVDYVIPGLCNAHSHAFQRALAGHTEQRSPAGHDNFWSWRERMYALAQNIDAISLAAIASEAYAEMLASGFTSVVEFHYLHRDPGAHGINDKSSMAMYSALASAAERSGIRMTYVPVQYERAGFSAPQPTAQQANFCMPIEDYLDHVAAVREGLPSTDAAVRVGIGAHSLRAVSAESLQKIAELADTDDLPMHIHVAEQTREVDDCMSHYHRRPVRWLLENFDVGPRWSLVHATHMDHDEITALAESNAVAVLCPSTEANLGDGLFPLHAFLSAGGNVAIGSDSHISINPFEELRWLEYGQRLASRIRNVATIRDSHTGAELFTRALAGGDQSAGFHGSALQKGGRADLVVLNADDPMLAGHNDASRLDALVFSGYPLPVERVMVNGVWQLVDACHRNRTEIVDDFAKTMQKLRISI